MQQLREEDRRIARERALRRAANRAAAIEQQREERNARADAIAAERERLKRERLQARREGKMKRKQIEDAFEQIKIRGGEITKLDRKTQRQLGVDLEQLNLESKSPELGRQQRQHRRTADHSARPKSASRKRAVDSNAASSTAGAGSISTGATSSAAPGSEGSSEQALHVPLPQPPLSAREERPSRKKKVSKSTTMRARPKSALVSRRAKSSTINHAGRPRGRRARPATSRPRRSSSGRQTVRRKRRSRSRGAAKSQPADPEQAIESLRRRQNEQLLKVLEEEQRAEERRERMLRTVQDEEDRRRLERVFGLERAKSSERIMRLTEEHEMVLASKMAKFGMIR